MMDNRRNYYRILHVQPDAPVEIIRTSYRTLMQRLRMHPDLGGDHWNATLINEAYRVLTDPARREHYDRRNEFLRRADVAAAAPSRTLSEPDAAATDNADACDRQDLCCFCLATFGSGKGNDPEAVCPCCESPLFRADHTRHEQDDQRAVRRIDRALAVSFYTAWPAAGRAGTTRDISPNGLRFVTNHPVTEGQRLKITSEVFDAVVWVTHCHVQPGTTRVEWIVGAAFETLKYRCSKGAFFSARA